MHAIAKFLARNKGFITFMLCMIVFRSAVADWNVVPTGSMQPTIQIGDRIFVDKAAYDVRLPFTHVSLIHLADPKRGDIVVLDSQAANERLVKRVIGLPGDEVAMRCPCRRELTSSLQLCRPGAVNLFQASARSVVGSM